MSDMSNKKIAITGTIGSGKSTVTKILSRYYPTISSDEIVSTLYQDSNVVETINDILFNTYSIELDRPKISELIFSDKQAKRKLESFIHPLVKEKIMEFIDDQNSFCFVEVPLLFEAEFNTLFDIIILVVADDDLVYERLVKYRNYTDEQVRDRINNQFPVSKKMIGSDYIVYNNGSLEELESNVKDILRKIECGNNVIREI